MGALDGKVALVTGAASGIGKATAIALAAEGAAVALADIAPLDETVDSIRAAGGNVQAFPCDVTDEADSIRLVRDVAKGFDALDILVNNAGVILEKPLLETTAADFDHVVGVNLRGVFLVGREAIRVMAKQSSGGRVINTASDLGYLGRADFCAYCASKGGVLALTRSWAHEFAPAILVNAVAPGPIETPMLDAEHMSPEWREKELDIPMARFGRPEEVASVIVFLAGPNATYITGQAFGPNGGSVMP